jgi:drug/metabolite transporter (DMT)-like permease
MLPLPIIIDWRFQFFSQRTHNNNNASSFCSQSPLIRLIQSKFPDRNNFWLLALCGILLMLNQILFIIGLSLTDATIASVTQPFAAIFTCVLAILMKQKPESALKIIGVIIAVIRSVFMLIASGLSKEKNQQSSSNGIFGMTFTVMGLLVCLCLLANTLYMVLLASLYPCMQPDTQLQL